MTAASITALRQRLGMTVEEFAKAMGLPPATICRWEEGRGAPPSALAQSAAATLAAQHAIEFIE